MRVSAALCRLMRLPGVHVRSVAFLSDRVVVRVGLRRRRLVCGHYSFSTGARENEQAHESVWRHLDLGVWRLDKGDAAPLGLPDSRRACRGRPVRPTALGSPATSRPWSRGWRPGPTTRKVLERRFLEEAERNYTRYVATKANRGAGAANGDTTIKTDKAANDAWRAPQSPAARSSRTGSPAPTPNSCTSP